MSTAKFVVKNLRKFKTDLERADKKRVKAAETATRVEAFRLMKELKAELRESAPGGRRLDPLSEIAKRRRYGAAKNKGPLYRMAIPVRYRIDRVAGNFMATFGIVDPKKGPGLSKSWKRLARIHQSGARMAIDQEMRKGLLAMGRRLKKRGDPAAKYFFLKPGTTHIDIPARPFIDPFWRAHRARAEHNIARNFMRKLRGERI